MAVFNMYTFNKHPFISADRTGRYKLCFMWEVGSVIE